MGRFYSSDDTLLMLATCRGLIKKGDTVKNISNEYIKIYDNLKDPIRGSGFTTLNNLKKIIDKQNIVYDKQYGGNSPTIRAIPIGLVFYNDIDQLIKVSIETGRLTHNYIYGYMGSFIGALFTSFAFKKIMPWEWVNRLIDILLSDKIEKYLQSTFGYDEYKKDIDKIINIFSDYQEKRLDKILHQNDMFKFEMNRWEFLLKYSPQIFEKPEKDYSKFGQSGIDVVIIALDSLISSLISNKDEVNLNKRSDFDFSWESLVQFSSLHFGDNDSTGALAGAWYGALLGYHDVFGQFKTLEFIADIIKMSNKLVSLNKIK
jgi:ADP-ribosylarginine hydrolase